MALVTRVHIMGSSDLLLHSLICLIDTHQIIVHFEKHLFLRIHVPLRLKADREYYMISSYLQYQHIFGVFWIYPVLFVSCWRNFVICYILIADVKAMCKSDPTRCETYAICDTLQGNLNCRCKRGYFVKHRECSGETLDMCGYKWRKCHNWFRKSSVLTLILIVSDCSWLCCTVMAQWQARCIIFEGMGGQTYPKSWQEKREKKPFQKS